MTAIALGSWGLGAAAHADGPGVPTETPGGLHGLAPLDGPNDWSQLTRLPDEKAAKETQAAAPQSAVEAPAAGNLDAPVAPAAAAARASAPDAARAVAVTQLPATGAGPRRHGGFVLVAAVLVAVAGAVCVGASRLTRASRWRR